MAAAGVILVLAYVPYIEIKSFSPLGFDFREGGELSVWGILAVLLVYYAFRFSCDCWVDYTGWMDTHRAYLAMARKEPPGDYVYKSHVQRLFWKFWLLDVAPPALMFLAALVAAVQQVVPLVKPPP